MLKLKPCSALFLTLGGILCVENVVTSHFYCAVNHIGKEDEKISKRIEEYTGHFEDVEMEFQKLMASVEYVPEELVQTNKS